MNPSAARPQMRYRSRRLHPGGGETFHFPDGEGEERFERTVCQCGKTPVDPPRVSILLDFLRIGVRKLQRLVERIESWVAKRSSSFGVWKGHVGTAVCWRRGNRWRTDHKSGTGSAVRRNLPCMASPKACCSSGKRGRAFSPCICCCARARPRIWVFLSPLIKFGVSLVGGARSSGSRFASISKTWMAYWGKSCAHSSSKSFNAKGGITISTYCPSESFWRSQTFCASCCSDVGAVSITPPS